MKRFILTGVLSLALLLVLTACGGAPRAGQSGGSSDNSARTSVSVCLEWTPNTNHTGLYAAQSLGYFEEAGLDVTILQPPEDGATAICAAGQVEFAVSAQDSIGPALAREDPLGVTAVAAILQHNTSGIISRAGEGMDRPVGLEGRTYSTWNSPMELAVMEEVITADGGDFSKVNLIPNNIVDEAGALREHQTDAIWIYYGWGGIFAKESGLDFDYFYFKDIDPVFDYCTPILIANNDFLEEHPDTAKAFLAAVSKGYTYAIEHPDEAAQILIDSDTTGSLAGTEDAVKASQEWISGQYQAEAERWGQINPENWNAFYRWLDERGLLEHPIPENFGFSNDYLPQ